MKKYLTVFCILSFVSVIFVVEAEFREITRGTAIGYLEMAAAWIPIMAAMITAYVYIPIFINNRFEAARKYCCMNLMCLCLCAAAMLTLPLIMNYVGRRSLIIVFIVMGLFCLVVQTKIHKTLMITGYNLSSETDYIAGIRSIFEESYPAVHVNQRRLNVLFWCNFIACVMEIGISTYIMLVTISAIIGSIFLTKLRKEYVKNELADRKESYWMVFNYYFCLALSILSYKYHYLLTIAILYGCRYRWMMIDYRWIRSNAVSKN